MTHEAQLRIAVLWTEPTSFHPQVYSRNYRTDRAILCLVHTIL
jgi:hypothetical protein